MDTAHFTPKNPKKHLRYRINFPKLFKNLWLKIKKKRRSRYVVTRRKSLKSWWLSLTRHNFLQLDRSSNCRVKASTSWGWPHTSLSLKAFISLKRVTIRAFLLSKSKMKLSQNYISRFQSNGFKSTIYSLQGAMWRVATRKARDQRPLHRYRKQVTFLIL